MCISDKKDFNREAPKQLKPHYFVKKHENHDISFRRVGVNGNISRDTDNKSEQSHYFIKFHESNYIFSESINT